MCGNRVDYDCFQSVCLNSKISTRWCLVNSPTARANIIRKSEQTYKELNLDLDNDREVINAIIKYPKILQRPIIINDNKAVIGRPPEKTLESL